MEQKRVIIVGGGATGLFAAAAIKKNCPEHEVIVIHDPKIPFIGVGEALAFNGPHFFKKYLGLHNDLEWVNKSDSAFKFGVNWKGFYGKEEDFYMSVSINPSTKFLYNSVWKGLTPNQMLAGQDGVATLFETWLSMRHKGLIDESKFPSTQQALNENYNFAKYNRMAINNNGTSMTNRDFGYSYHINANKIKDVIHELVGLPAGVKEIQANVKDAHVDEFGKVQYVTLEDDTKIYGDLFIDASGFSRLIIKKLPYIWNNCDDSINNTTLIGHHRFKDYSEATNCTVLHAMDYGWRFSISLNERSGEGYQFNKNIFSDEDKLVDEYYRKTGRTDVQFKKLSWQPGYHNKSFISNCIALGISHGFIDVFDSNNFSATIRYIGVIIDNLQEDKNFEFAWRDEFNDLVWANTQDIILRIHSAFHLAPRNDTIYWQQMKEFGKEQKTLEQFYDAFYDPNRAKSVKNAKGIYSMITLTNFCEYFGIPIHKDPRALKNISPATEALLLNFAEFSQKRNGLLYQTANTTAEFTERFRSGVQLQSMEELLSAEINSFG